MLVCALLLLCAGVSSGAPTTKVTIVQDWITTNATIEFGLLPSSGYVSGFGFLKHASSGKFILPDGGLCPGDESKLRIGPTITDKENMFRFVQYAGHMGYFEHHCGLVVHPHGGSSNPGQNTRAVLHTDRHHGSHFYYDEELTHIVHRGSRIMHPHGGSNNPDIGTEIRLHSDIHSAAKFEFVPADEGASIYPVPVLTGRWEVLFAVIDPISEHTYEIRYKVGKSITRQATEISTWKVSGGTAFLWFKASAEYSYYACISEAQTWTAEIERTYTVKVYPGRTSVTWQWVFDADRLEEGFRFRSTILGDTDSIHTPPTLEAVNTQAKTC